MIQPRLPRWARPVTAAVAGLAMLGVALAARAPLVRLDEGGSAAPVMVRIRLPAADPRPAAQVCRELVGHARACARVGPEAERRGPDGSRLLAFPIDPAATAGG